MDLTINIEDYLETNKIKISPIVFQKMNLIYNALDEGWSIKKKGTSYIFTKKHENKKEIIEDSYLLKFMKSNLDLHKTVEK
jgi:hypothetical protein|uniref:Uncharacterized protein n=1 Tax=viral metagenome TaxID=1070528 RepID=A0A6C0JF65_9ZZZZ